MSKEFYDKYGKIVDCFSCNCIEPCSKSDSPLCSEGYVFFAKDKIADLETKLAEKEKEIECLRTRQFIDMTEKEMLELKIATHNEDLKKIKHIFDQDKISFAVSYLEVLKAFIIDKEFYYLGEDYSTVYVEDIIEEIDN